MIGGRMEKEYIEKRLINKIGKKRWAHSLRVLKEAEKLANLYGADLKQVYLAALLHDCGKLQDKDELLKRAKHFGIILDDIRMNNLELIHAPLGAKIAEKEFKITDKNVLKAIKYHTTGREGMSLLEKIIFLADYIEEARSFPGVEKVRQLAYKDLDRAIFQALDQTIK